VIADHVSASWSLEHVVAALNSANLTVQWSMINDSLYSGSTNNGGSLLRFGNGALTFHHNLYANNYNASPHLGDNLSLDFVNNVIYGWGTNAGFTLDEGVTNELNYVCNYLIANTNSFLPNIAFRGGTTNTWIFQTNNFIDSNTNLVLDGAPTGWAMFTNKFTPFAHEFPMAPVSTDEAYKAYERVLDFAGLSLMARDSADTNTVTGVRNQTGTFTSVSGPLPVIVSTLLPLDSDQDGIPDYWETTFGQNPTNADSFQPSTHDIGYTTLEEYLNWLAAPNALTITNTPVSVDLLKLFGNTGNLSFEVTNSIHGLVYLTNVLVTATGAVTNTGPFSNSICVFTPTNNFPFVTNYYGYAAFDVTVTNNTTFAYFGPVTVSVVVSAIPIVYGSLNTNPPVFVATPSNQVVNEQTTLTVTNNATDADTNQTLSYVVSMVVDTNAMLSNNWPLNFATTIPSPVISTNGVITWTPSEAQGPGVYIITTVATDNGIPPLSATNSFSVTVNEVNRPPSLPVFASGQTNYFITALTTLTVTNTATDPDIPPNPLTYAVNGSPAATNAVIATNGIFTWTPGLTQLGLFTFTTIVTDNNQYALFNQSLTATNVFTVFVSPAPGPFAFTQPAQAVTGSSAQLNGMVTPNGQPTTAWFEWGTNTSYGNQTPTVGSGNGYNVVYTTNTISGLLTNVPYHFRLVASNIVGVVYGFDQVLDEANVVAWGANYVGQSSVPAGLSNAVAVAGAYDHSLALKNNGTVATWGVNFTSLTNVPSDLTNAVAVAGGYSYSLALRNNGTVTVWGQNFFPGLTNVPVGLSNVVNIASGTFASLALKNNGLVAAWGFSSAATVPTGLSNVVSIAGGFIHSLAIKNDGTVTAWGDDSYGQTDVPANLSNVVAIAAGAYHNLALKSDGTVVAWGDNSDGQTNVLTGLSNVVAIAAGGYNSLALKKDGSLVGWGDNSVGQNTPPTGVTNFVAISSGNLHTLALTSQAIVGLTNIVLNFTNGVPVTNTIAAGGVTYYQINVPSNADFATNILYTLNTNQTLNLWFSTNVPPTIGATNDSLLLGAVTNGVSTLSTTSAPTNIIPGRTYYLGVQNTNNFTVFYGIEVDFHLTSTGSQTNTIPISGILYTNGGFLLTWYAPSNDLFQVQWSDNIPFNWQTFTNIVSYNTNYAATSTNATFTFFDPSPNPMRFYQLILLGSAAPSSNTPPVLPAQGTRTVNPLTLLVVTNTATDAEAPPQTLTYMFTSTVVGANQPVINSNGIITWTPDLSQAGTSSVFKTIVTDNGVPALSATNFFTVMVAGASQTNTVPISGITYTNIGATNGFLLTWFAPSNELFQVQWSDNLPFNWQTFSNIISYNTNYPASSANATFTFFDGGSNPTRFYQLILLGSPSSTSNTPPSLPAQSLRVVNPLNLLIVTNTATDSDSPAQTLTYSLLSAPTGAVINTSGVITWTPTVALAGTSNTITTVVTDNGSPNLSATNSFVVIVNPTPDFSSILYTNGDFLLTWLAPTNDIFMVQVATNLGSTGWQMLATNITYHGLPTTTNGWFSYLDVKTNTLVPFGTLRFYRLVLTGVTSSAVAPPVAISSIILSNGNFLLTWFAPATNKFNVKWTTNIAVPIIWTPFPDVITSTNGTFTFLDTNAPMLMKFYELILLP
jgi:alpha-tubulin suppressor-like RCC1 family protein